MENSEQSERLLELALLSELGKVRARRYLRSLQMGKLRDASQSDFYVGPSGASSRPLANISKGGISGTCTG